MVREKIRTAIETSDWSQHTLSAKVGIKTPNLNAFLKGTRPLPYPTLVKVLDELALTIGPKSQPQSIMPPSEMPEIFRQAIDLKGEQIKDIADSTEVNVASLSTFLNGSRSMPVRNIEKIMRALDLDIIHYIKPRKK